MWFKVRLDPNNIFTKQLLLTLFCKRGNWSLARLYNMHRVKQSITGVPFPFSPRHFFSVNWWLWRSNVTLLLSPVVAILSLLLHWLHSIYWAHAVYVNHIYSTFEETVKWEIKLGSPDLCLKKKNKTTAIWIRFSSVPIRWTWKTIPKKFRYGLLLEGCVAFQSFYFGSNYTIWVL